MKNLKRRGRLRRLEPYVLRRYCEFHVARHHLERLPRRAWEAEAKDALRHCYDGGGNGLANVKKAFLDSLSVSARARCPYCMMRQPGTIDHYLPLDHFPEFSVLQSNWVYVCERCNRRKGSRLVTPPRSVLNPYFDSVSSTHPLLYADVSIVAGALSVSFFAPHPNLLLPNPELAAIANRQFRLLCVAEEMRAEAGSVISTTIGTIVTLAIGPLTVPQLTNQLQARRRNLDSFGVNGWERALVEALELCADLHEYVNDLIATRPPLQPLPLPRNLGLVQKATAIAAQG